MYIVHFVRISKAISYMMWDSLFQLYQQVQGLDKSFIPTPKKFEKFDLFGKPLQSALPPEHQSSIIHQSSSIIHH